MNFKINLFRNLRLGYKIATGYAIVIFFAIFTGIYSYIILQESIEIDEAISKTYSPLISDLEQLDNHVSSSKKLTKSWIYSPAVSDKEELMRIHNELAPPLVTRLKSIQWQESGLFDQDSLLYTVNLFEENLSNQQTIMNSLQNVQDYDSAELIFPVIELFEDKLSSELTDISERLKKSIIQLQDVSGKLITKKYESFESLKSVLIIMSILGAMLGILSAIFTINSILSPVNKLNELIKRMGLGELPDIAIKKSGDEIGVMVDSMMKLKDALSKTQYFANQIGQGNLYVEYELLSDKDELGRSLIDMRDNLNQVIFETNEVVQAAGQEGDLGARIEIENKEGAWKLLSDSINNLLASVGEPILEVNQIVKALANGDLTQRYEKVLKGQLSELTIGLNTALDNLSSLIFGIIQAAKTVEQSSTEMLTTGEEMSISTTEISGAISEMSNGAQNQVHKVDESSRLIETILNSAKEMGIKSSGINTAAQQGVSNSSKGNEMINGIVDKISELSDYSKQTNESMKVLSTRSDEITSVLSVITEISSQTNLLALNAAIEAAQAGDAGRGFAVVAEEIRKLAEGSRKSAKEIEKLVHSVREDTNRAVNVTETMSKNVLESVASSKETAKVFEEIAAASAQTLMYSEEILNSSKLQEQSITDVVSITESVVVIAEETASGSEEVASSASQLSVGMENFKDRGAKLNQLALNLKSSVESFNLGGG